MPWQTGETVYTRGKALHAQDPRKAYPTGMAVDLLIRKILDSKFYRERVPDHLRHRAHLPAPAGLGAGLARRRGPLRRGLHVLRAPALACLVGGELLIIEDVLGRRLLPEKRHMRNGHVETIQETGTC